MQAWVGDTAMDGTIEWTPGTAMFPEGKTWLKVLVLRSTPAKADHKCSWYNQSMGTPWDGLGQDWTQSSELGQNSGVFCFLFNLRVMVRDRNSYGELCLVNYMCLDLTLEFSETGCRITPQNWMEDLLNRNGMSFGCRKEITKLFYIQRK